MAPLRDPAEDCGVLGKQVAGVRRQVRADVHGECQVTLVAGQFLEALGDQRGGRRCLDYVIAPRRSPAGRYGNMLAKALPAPRRRGSR